MSSNVFDLSGKTVLITGAAGGIGTATCHQLGGAGATIIATDVDESNLVRLKNELEAKKIKVHTYLGNASNEEDVVRIFSKAANEVGIPNILINNAAQGIHTPPQDTSVAEWDRVMDTSLKGYFLNAREFSKLVLKAKIPGSVVNIASIAGSSAIGRGNFAYSVAKGGVIQMTRELAIEWATAKIRVNAIQPCSVNTPGWRRWVETEGEKAQILMTRLLQGIPLGRVAEPEDIANAVHYLASDAAAMVTGVILPVDGGNLAFNAGGNLGHY
jgi:NAD(P)-dependent dehydrogenase (short-subunit alcohol dehydrogenase family)